MSALNPLSSKANGTMPNERTGVRKEEKDLWYLCEDTSEERDEYARGGEPVWIVTQGLSPIGQGVQQIIVTREGASVIRRLHNIYIHGWAELLHEDVRNIVRLGQALNHRVVGPFHPIAHEEYYVA